MPTTRFSWFVCFGQLCSYTVGGVVGLDLSSDSTTQPRGKRFREKVSQVPGRGYILRQVGWAVLLRPLLNAPGACRFLPLVRAFDVGRRLREGLLRCCRQVLLC